MHPLRIEARNILYIETKPSKLDANSRVKNQQDDAILLFDTSKHLQTLTPVRFTATPPPIGLD